MCETKASSEPKDILMCTGYQLSDKSSECIFLVYVWTYLNTVERGEELRIFIFVSELTANEMHVYGHPLSIK